MQTETAGKTSQSSATQNPSQGSMPASDAWSVLMGIGRKGSDWITSPASLKAIEDNCRSALTAIGPKLFTGAKCPRCGEEVSKNTETGVCLDCVMVDAEKATLDSKLEGMLGAWMKRNCTLDSFQTPTDAHREAKSVAVKFRPDKGSLFIQGPCGSGKTHLAVALLQEWASALRWSVGFERTSHLMRMIRGLRGYEEASYIENLAQKRLLVIDDLGVGRGTEFTLGVLYEIIAERTDMGRNGLIITSNLTLDGIAEKFGDDRLTSRIAGMCEVVKIDLPDWRGKPHFSQGDFQ